MKKAELTQRYSSKYTSINKRRPRIYSIIPEAVISSGTVIDYGCGRYFDLYELPETVTGYDKYWRDDPQVLDRSYDVAICSNVLNVIEEDTIRAFIISELRRLAPVAYITVYDGSRTGTGAASGEDSFQLNRKLSGYVSEIENIYGAGHVRISKGMIIATR